MMLKKSRVKFLESEVVAYPTTQMMRNLLVAQVCAKIPKHSHCHTHIQDSRKSVDEFLFSFFLGGIQRPQAVSDDVSPGELQGPC